MNIKASWFVYLIRQVYVKPEICGENRCGKIQEMTQDADLILFILMLPNPCKGRYGDTAIAKDKQVLILLNKSISSHVIDEEDIRSLTDSTILKTSMVDGTGLIVGEFHLQYGLFRQG